MFLIVGGFEWFQRGGWAMYPLAALSVWSLYVILSRTAYFLTTHKRLERDLDAVSRGNTALPERMEGELAPLLARAVKQGQLDTVRAEVAVEHELRNASQGVSSLDTIAQVGPMFGLVGTVSGMIHIFFKVSEAQGGIDVAMLSKGISEALVATWCGLAVAIPAFIAYRAFRGRLLGIENDLYTLVDDMRHVVTSRSHSIADELPPGGIAEANASVETRSRG
ncbi:MAG: MotA/TolQ/ExbB proton channel family protein [bacterium]|nr:MotA/TolQ/ExbB proton channel family protein [bacterium]